jgi:hypothetical protein
MTRPRGLTFAVIVGSVLLLLLATVSSASAATKFGANFNSNTQPSNASPAQECEPTDGDPCTWVMNQAFNANGLPQLALRAPRDGVIGKIKLLSATEGSFRLQLARTKSNPTRSKVVRQGPTIQYDGNGGAGCAPDCIIETFNVNLTVRKGDILSFRASEAGLLRCDSGGPKILMYQPPLVVGGSFQQPDATDGCSMLLRAIYK